MCGGCGGSREQDWAGDAVASFSARTAAARTAQHLCTTVGVRVSVTSSRFGWLLRWPTGKTQLAATLTGLWQAVVDRHPLPRLDAPPGGATTSRPPLPVTTARRALTVTIDPHSPGRSGWAGKPVADGAQLTCTDEAELHEVLTLFTHQPWRHRYRVAAITGVDWPELEAVHRPSLADLPVLATWAVAMHVAGHTRRRRLRATCGSGPQHWEVTVADRHGLGITLTRPGRSDPPPVPEDGLRTSSTGRDDHRLASSCRCGEAGKGRCAWGACCSGALGTP